MARIASFHLVRDRRAARAMVRLATDRPRLDRLDGLHFWRLLGTGRGDDTGAGADLRRTALFAVWDDEAALDAFLGSHPIAARREQLEESWHVRLRSLGGHGRWRGVDPLEQMEAGSADGAVAIITRADVRRRSWSDFGAASREVDAALRDGQGLIDGLIDVVGIGEAPVGRLATFSLWRSLADARRFAYATPRHTQVIEQTRDGDWYAEELFARFEPYASAGRWNGRDPLAEPSS